MRGRTSLAMSPDEIRGFLAEHRIGVVCGHDRNGVLTARRCGLHHDGVRLKLTLRPPLCTFDFARHPDVCVAVDTYPSYQEIKGVIIIGRAVWLNEAAVIGVMIERTITFDFMKEVATPS